MGGGSYDPPTYGHLICIAELLSTLKDDSEQIWIVPSGDGRVDKSNKCDASSRLSMLRLAIDSFFTSHNCARIKVIPIEVDRGTHFKTAELIEELGKQYPTKSFRFCIGDDLVKDLRKWYQSERLLKSTHFVIFKRLEDDNAVTGPLYSELFEGGYTIIETDNHSSASSTQARNRIHGDRNIIGRTLAGLCPPSVIKFIIDNKLYLKPTLSLPK